MNSPIGVGGFHPGEWTGNGDIYYNKDPQIWMVLKGQSHEINVYRLTHTRANWFLKFWLVLMLKKLTI